LQRSKAWGWKEILAMRYTSDTGEEVKIYEGKAPHSNLDLPEGWREDSGASFPHVDNGTEELVGKE
jgi:hypothetical protein